MDKELQGKSVVITGAGGNIGRACALRFAAGGARVMVSDIMGDTAQETVDLIWKKGGEAEVFVADVTDPEQVEALVAFACEKFGTLDVMFNNAGGDPPAPLHTKTVDDYRGIMALNLDSVYFGVQAALKVMLPNKSGCIISTSSGSGIRAVKDLAVYGAAKAAVINLMRSVAIEYGHEGIRANAIAPGPIKTPALEEYVKFLPEGEETFFANIPSRRFGTVDEIAEAAAFLASDKADYINGAVLPVDGGSHARF